MGGYGTKRAGFTLLELLVVIGIIGVLMALLLPALAHVRRHAQCARCLANLRSVGQLMIGYASDHNGWIAGSPSGSGRHLWRDSPGGTYASAGYTVDDLPPGAIELFDYIGPLADRSAGLQTPRGIDRLRAYRRLPSFMCPANGVIAARAGGAAVEDGPMLSYCTATAFLLLPPRIPTTANTTYAGRITMPTGGSSDDPAKFNFWSHPPGYAPKITRVGDASRKIYLADSGRRARHSGAPQFIYDVESDYADTLFSDFGPFYGVTRSYDRYRINNPSDTAATDGQRYAYRHGGRSTYLMNAVFFDGHAETLTDLQSTHPDLWLPSGSIIYRNTKLNATDTVFWNDVWDTYLQNVSPGHPYIVP